MPLVTTVPYGTSVNTDSSPKTYTYNSNGNVLTTTITDGIAIYQQTNTYNGTFQLTATSAWVEISHIAEQNTVVQ